MAVTVSSSQLSMPYEYNAEIEVTSTGGTLGVPFTPKYASITPTKKGYSEKEPVARISGNSAVLEDCVEGVTYAVCVKGIG